MATDAPQHHRRTARTALASTTRRLGGALPAALILLLLIWSTALTVALATGAGNETAPTEELDRLDQALDEATNDAADWGSDLETALGGMGEAINDLQADSRATSDEQQDILSRLDDAETALEDTTDQLDAHAALIAGVGQRLNLTETELQRLTSAAFGLGIPLEFDALGNLTDCVNANIGEIERTLRGTDFGIFLISTC